MRRLAPLLVLLTLTACATAPGPARAPLGQAGPDGMTLTIALAKAQEPCPGEPRITYEAERLESPTAVAVGLKRIIGEVAPGVTGNCAHDLAYRTADYTIRLDTPLGNRVLVDTEGNPISVSS